MRPLDNQLSMHVRNSDALFGRAFRSCEHSTCHSFSLRARGVMDEFPLLLPRKDASATLLVIAERDPERISVSCKCSPKSMLVMNV
jgi:hypothetical protein